jgi:hypothetical protein
MKKSISSSWIRLLCYNATILCGQLFSAFVRNSSFPSGWTEAAQKLKKVK